jgi:predicted acyltransferase
MQQENRISALDAMRGFTIIAMIMVNTPGSWSHVYPPLLHAAWNGATPTDYIFPFFLFIVGFSVVLAYQRRLEAGEKKPALVRKAALRTLKIFALGVFLWVFPEFDLDNIRWAGVLQRIALVFFPCALLFLYTDWKLWLRAGIATLLGYWIIMVYVPVPGIGAPDLSAPVKNWAHYLDSILLPGKMWQKTWDPEGLLSTLPSIVTGITGMLLARIFLDTRETYQRLSYLFLAGFAMFVLGGALAWFFPLNKHIWSSSFVLHTSGLAGMTLAAWYYLVDIRGIDWWTAPGRIFGANAIVAYVLANMLTLVFYNGLNDWWMDTFIHAGAPPKLVSLVYAILYVGILFIPIYFLYRRKVFIKL